jgi:phosphoribosyl-AMP cyclohydrolase
LITFIYQDQQTKKISKVEQKNSIQDDNYLMDCDSDSILFINNYSEYIENYEIKEWKDPFKELIPVVALDEKGVVLMQAFVNHEALNLSIDKGLAHYYSRSRDKLWKKGEESGHTQNIISIFHNKVYNFYIYNVRQNMVACHTGFYSCFYRRVLNGKIEEIYPSPFTKINGDKIND